jgi:hypothetical protein
LSKIWWKGEISPGEKFLFHGEEISWRNSLKKKFCQKIDISCSDTA